MHRYLKAAGFSDYMSETAVNKLIAEVVKTDNISAELILEDGSVVREYRMPVNEYIGICVAVLFVDNKPRVSYYFPYFDSYADTTDAPCTVERMTAVENYQGIIDDYRQGISLIFFISNPLDYRKRKEKNYFRFFKGTSLTAFANGGSVLLPVAHPWSEDEDFFGRGRNRSVQGEPGTGQGSGSGNRGEGDFRNHWDPEAPDDGYDGDWGFMDGGSDRGMEYYREINERMQNEDVYSLVDQSLMPTGIECDQYLVIGELTNIEAAKNTMTGEALYLMDVSCNGVEFKLCMRQDDLLGVPLPGRRIKARIWLTGNVNFRNG